VNHQTPSTLVPQMPFQAPYFNLAGRDLPAEHTTVLLYKFPGGARVIPTGVTILKSVRETSYLRDGQGLWPLTNTKPRQTVLGWGGKTPLGGEGGGIKTQAVGWDPETANDLTPR